MRMKGIEMKLVYQVECRKLHVKVDFYNEFDQAREYAEALPYAELTTYNYHEPMDWVPIKREYWDGVEKVWKIIHKSLIWG